MKVLAFILIWLALFAGFFFLLSLFGLLWYPSYRQIITDGDWFICYSLLIGWILPSAIVAEIDDNNELF